MVQEQDNVNVTTSDGTTHGEVGGGNPHLVIASQEQIGRAPANERRVFALSTQRSTIGSSADADLVLDGLNPVHAVIEHDKHDEYVLFLNGAADTSGHPNREEDSTPGYVLRTGYQFEIGDWELVFMREEANDHGRPFGGREGGEGSEQPQQPARPGSEADPLSYEVEE